MWFAIIRLQACTIVSAISVNILSCFSPRLLTWDLVTNWTKTLNHVLSLQSLCPPLAMPSLVREGRLNTMCKKTSLGWCSIQRHRRKPRNLSCRQDLNGRLKKKVLMTTHFSICTLFWNPRMSFLVLREISNARNLVLWHGTGRKSPSSKTLLKSAISGLRCKMKLKLAGVHIHWWTLWNDHVHCSVTVSLKKRDFS